MNCSQSNFGSGRPEGAGAEGGVEATTGGGTLMSGGIAGGRTGFGGGTTSSRWAREAFVDSDARTGAWRSGGVTDPCGRVAAGPGDTPAVPGVDGAVGWGGIGWVSR